MFISTNKTRGLTLIEVLFASGIIALVAIGVVAMFVQTTGVSKRLDYKYTALNLAKSRIERARAAMGTGGHDTLPDLAETDTVIDGDGVSDENGNFMRTTAVTQNYGGNARLTMVEVDVTYKYLGGWKTDSSTTLSTLFSDYN